MPSSRNRSRHGLIRGCDGALPYSLAAAAPAHASRQAASTSGRAAELSMPCATAMGMRMPVKRSNTPGSILNPAAGASDRSIKAARCTRRAMPFHRRESTLVPHAQIRHGLSSTV
jgi:hypothetical protein